MLICSTETLKKRITEYSIYFQACGYKKHEVLKAMNKVLTLTQEECLTRKPKETSNRIPLVTHFQPTLYVHSGNCK